MIFWSLYAKMTWHIDLTTLKLISHAPFAFLMWPWDNFKWRLCLVSFPYWTMPIQLFFPPYRFAMPRPTLWQHEDRSTNTLHIPPSNCVLLLCCPPWSSTGHNSHRQGGACWSPFQWLGARLHPLTPVAGSTVEVHTWSSLGQRADLRCPPWWMLHLLILKVPQYT